MKKWMALFITVMMVFGATACSAEKGDTTQVATNPAADKTVEEIVNLITEDAGIETQTMITPLDADNFSWYLFIDPIEGAEAVSADAMMSAVAHSVVLLRVPDGTDAEAVAKEIEEKADPRKWICVEAEKTIVKVNGNLILLIMSNPEVADQVAENFTNLK
ncbi:hypothetical protein QE109_11900 [Fusibacter bizertensis]|uniref:DUF4358 domain-containing protein n=1 Tax=Fusibacter bizertensis TaxID=1488331 RepID=A0ABT6NEJ1_9FIRM|nr:hypothetical protein [Fusibacter bizertensis]MDH8678858.1 hypothetical protein [Fusibacter bizertensis]